MDGTHEPSIDQTIVPVTNRPSLLRRTIVFVSTYICYLSLHSARKSYSNLKSAFISVWTPDNKNASIVQTLKWHIKASGNETLFDNEAQAEMFLGILDALFLLMYSIFLFISGYLGDKFNRKLVLSIGIVGSSICTLLFGYFTEIFQIYNTVLYAFAWSANAIFQSAGWPVLIAILGEYFPSNEARGILLGMWSSCASVGNIVGAEVAVNILSSGYQNVFLFNSVFMLIAAVFVVIALSGSPVPMETNIGTSHQSSFGFRDACCRYGVIPCGLSFACIKLVLYSFFFWLPLYLHNKYRWPDEIANQLSVWFDIGCIFGGVCIGMLSDIIRHRYIVVEVSLSVSVPLLFIYLGLSNDKTGNAIVMTLIGFFIGGGGSIISTAITADLGNDNADANESGEGTQKSVLSTVAGIIDGIGSFGAAIGQLLIPTIHNAVHGDWKPVFYMLITSDILAIVFLFPSLIRELKWSLRNGICNCQQRPEEVPFADSDSLQNE